MQHLLFSFLISLVVTSIGFKKTVWFISIGYTMAIVSLCILSFILYRPVYSFFNYLQVLLLFTWGSRLGFFIMKRESDTNYRSSVKEQTGASSELTLLVKAGIWVSVSLLYVCMYSPAIFTIQSSAHSSLFINIVMVTGLLLMSTGITTETIADSQKTKFKKLNPKSYCNTGLYRWVRCPNYLGEILVWLGSFICAIAFYNNWWQWMIAAIGLFAIILIMMGSAKRLEKKQSQTYGTDPAFREYEKTIPILFPWIPLFSLQNIKVYLE